MLRDYIEIHDTVSEKRRFWKMCAKFKVFLKVRVGVLEYSPYAPDLSPPDY